VRRGSPSSASSMRLEVALGCDRRLAEEVILAVRALSRRFGLDEPHVTIVKRASAAPSVKRRRSSPTPRSRARETPSPSKSRS
jgi:hypothetical protein